MSKSIRLLLKNPIIRIYNNELELKIYNFILKHYDLEYYNPNFMHFQYRFRNLGIIFLNAYEILFYYTPFL